MTWNFSVSLRKVIIMSKINQCGVRWRWKRMIFTNMLIREKRKWKLEKSCAPSPHPFKVGMGVNFDYLLWKAGTWKIKEGESIVQGQVFLKGRWGGTFPIYFSTFSIIFKFYHSSFIIDNLFVKGFKRLKIDFW